MEYKWKLKAIIQKTISFLPYSRQCNYFFQKYITKGVALNNIYFEDRLSHAISHLEVYKNNFNKIPQNSLEIGTGWYPVVPIYFFLMGVNTIYSIDIESLITKKRLKTTLEKFLSEKENLENNHSLNFKNINKEKWQILSNLLLDIENISLEEAFNALHFQYLIQDARDIKLPENSIEFINSNNTFEHIYPKLLVPILVEFKRIINKKNGAMSHAIDLSDHFAHFDNSISVYNFLKYSDSEWKKIDNNIQPQNRLRKSEYLSIFSELNIPYSILKTYNSDKEKLKTIKLAEKYKDFKIEDLEITQLHIESIFKADL